MPLSLIVENLEQVPEPLREEYTEKDGKFHLNVDGVVPTSQYEELEKRYAYLDGTDPEEVKGALNRVREIRDKKMIEEGEFEKWASERVRDATKKYEGELAELRESKKSQEARIRDYENQFNARKVQDLLSETFAELNVSPRNQEAVNFLFGRISQGFELHKDGKLLAVDPNGRPRLDEKGERVTLKDDMTKFLRANPWILKDSKGATVDLTGAFDPDTGLRKNDPRSIQERAKERLKS